MDFSQVSETIEFSSLDGAVAPSVNAYLKNGWSMLSCCTHTNEVDDSQYTYVLLGWAGTEKAPHLGNDFQLTD